MKKIVLIAILLFAAIIMASSGAFTSVSAERDATIAVANDSEALLGLVPTSNFSIEENGILTINVSNANMNAITTFGDVFKIVNNGSKDAILSLSWTNSENIVFTVASGTSEYVIGELNTFTTSSISNISLPVGAELYVSMGVRTENTTVTSTLTIDAIANVSNQNGNEPDDNGNNGNHYGNTWNNRNGD